MHDSTEPIQHPAEQTLPPVPLPPDGEPSSSGEASPPLSSAQLQALIASLPPWQQEFLTATQAGLPFQQARLKANVSPYTIRKFLLENSLFARAYQAILRGLAATGTERASTLAKASAPHLVEHAIDKATTAKFDRDQATFTRIGLEAAQVLGQRDTPVVAIQVNAATVALEQWQSRKKRVRTQVPTEVGREDPQGAGGQGPKGA